MQPARYEPWIRKMLAVKQEDCSPGESIVRVNQKRAPNSDRVSYPRKAKMSLQSCASIHNKQCRRKIAESKVVLHIAACSKKCACAREDA